MIRNKKLKMDQKEKSLNKKNYHNFPPNTVVTI